MTLNRERLAQSRPYSSDLMEKCFICNKDCQHTYKFEWISDEASTAIVLRGGDPWKIDVCSSCFSQEYEKAGKEDLIEVIINLLGELKEKTKDYEDASSSLSDLESAHSDAMDEIGDALGISKFSSKRITNLSEIADRVRSALEEKKSEGFEEGKAQGIEEGKAAGFDAGNDEGYNEGYSSGHDEGYEEGREEGYAAGASESGRGITD